MKQRLERHTTFYSSRIIMLAHIRLTFRLPITFVKTEDDFALVLCIVYTATKTFLATEGLLLLFVRDPI